jgi:hypothetical protein
MECSHHRQAVVVALEKMMQDLLQIAKGISAKEQPAEQPVN